MKKIVLIGLLSILLASFVAGCGGGGAAASGEKEPNNTISKANPITLDESTAITINPEGDVDWFKTELPEQGYLKVQAGEVPEELGLEIAFSLYKEWEDEKEERFRGWNKLPDAVFIPEQGTYYFAIQDDYNDDFSKNPVNIKASFKKEFDTFEPNNSAEESKMVEIGSVVEPAIFPEDDEDWFKVNVKEQGYLMLMAKEIPEDITPEIIIATYDEWAEPKVEEIRGWKKLPDACFISDSGEYLIRLHDDYDDDYSESNFKLKIDFLKEMDEGEPNDDFREAKYVERGDTLNVAIFPEDDRDYYRIKIHEGKNLKLMAKGFSDIVPEAMLLISDKDDSDELKEVSDWQKLPAEFKVEENKEYFILLHDDYDDEGSSKPFKLLIE